MSDTTHLAAPAQAPADANNLISAFGFKFDGTLPATAANELLEIAGLFGKHSIDAETAAGLIRSYEHHSGQAEEPGIRIKNFLRFIRNMPSREGLLDSVKSMGLFSKFELEEYARETGDWTHFLRRIEGKKK